MTDRRKDLLLEVIMSFLATAKKKNLKELEEAINIILDYWEDLT